MRTLISVGSGADRASAARWLVLGVWAVLSLGCLSFRSVTAAGSVGQLVGARATAIPPLLIYCDAENILAGATPTCPRSRVEQYVKELAAYSQGLAKYGTALRNLAEYNDPRIGEALRLLAYGGERLEGFNLQPLDATSQSLAGGAYQLGLLLTQQWRRKELKRVILTSHPHVTAVVNGLLKSGDRTDVRMGVLSAGSGGDFCRLTVGGHDLARGREQLAQVLLQVEAHLHHPRIGQHLAHHVRTTPGAVFYGCQHAQPHCILLMQFEQLDGHHDRSQGVVEIMSDASSQCAEAFHALGAEEHAAIRKELSRLTGLDEGFLERANLRVTPGPDTRCSPEHNRSEK